MTSEIENAADPVLRGIARCFWAMAWADELEENGGPDAPSLSGTDIYCVMPPVPDAVFLAAAKVYGHVESVAGPMYLLTAAAAQAMRPEAGTDAALSCDEEDRLGVCIAYKWCGAGVCWTDDYPDFGTPSGTRPASLWSALRVGFEMPDDIREAARESVAEEYPITHWSYGSGMVGCLYDNGPNFTDTRESAIECLAQTFSDLPDDEIAAMRAALLTGSIHYFGTVPCYDSDGTLYPVSGMTTIELFTARQLAGADYCEISEHDGPCPQED